MTQPIQQTRRYNAETEKVLSKAKKGIEVHRVKNSKKLFKALGI